MCVTCGMWYVLLFCLNVLKVLCWCPQVPLPVDVVAEVQACLMGGNAVLTVPWVVEFLSMMDVVAPRLHHLNHVLTLLVQVYRLVLSLASLKPIFHWILGLRWQPNANEINTKNMKCTWPTRKFCVWNPTQPIFH